MPKIHAYVNKIGFYIKSVHQGRITTYQVSKQGYNYLLNHGYEDSDEINVKFLLHLIKLRYVYTKGNGPGDITPFIATRANNSKHQDKNTEQINNGIGYFIIFIIIFALAIFILSMYFKR